MIEVTREQNPLRKRDGVTHANYAINALIRIPKDDALRERGFQIVADWIKSNSETNPNKENNRPYGEAVGVFYANEAINCLIKIHPDDELRERGFRIVADFIKSNQQHDPVAA